MKKIVFEISIFLSLIIIPSEISTGYIDKSKILYDIKKDIKVRNFIFEKEHIIKLKRYENINRKFVLVTAYNSIYNQTDNDPFIAAWGDKLNSNMKIIAISKDLEELGLTRGKIVNIENLGNFKVLDRMNERKRNKIDIYMGLNIDKALSFGIKKLEISWNNENKLKLNGEYK